MNQVSESMVESIGSNMVTYTEANGLYDNMHIYICTMTQDKTK